MPPQFEYDLLKSLSNWWKHGISLAEAERLWLDPCKRYVRAHSTPAESRYALLATHEGKIYHATFSPRGGKIRLVSCRRARKKEAALYQH